MASVGDKYSITTYQYEDSDLFGANAFINVFAYEASGGSPSASDLWDEFYATAVSDWLVCINNHFVLKTAIIINMDDPTDFLGVALSDAGDIADDQLNDFMAFEFQYVRAVRGVHHGRKSFAGIGESMLSSGTATVTQQALLNTLATTLGAPVVGASGTYLPRIWRRAGNYAPWSGTPPTGTPYPDTFYPISSVVYNRVSTQNSRKR